MDFEQISQEEIKGYTIPEFGIMPTDDFFDILKKISKKFSDLENLIKDNYVIEGESDMTYTTGEYTLSISSTDQGNFLNFDFSNLSPANTLIDTTIKVYSTNENGTLFPIYTPNKDKGTVLIEGKLLPIKVVVDHRTVQAGRTLHFTTTKDLNLKSEVKDYMDLTFPIKNYTVKDSIKSLQNKVDLLSSKIK